MALMSGGVELLAGFEHRAEAAFDVRSVSLVGKAISGPTQTGFGSS